VPGITDQEDELFRLGYFIGGLPNLKALDVLPYHTMGETKYKKLGIEYPLAGVPALTSNEAIIAKQHIIDGIKKRRSELAKSDT
jgi:pyruvate formate lyase activating enzyme